MIKVAEFILLWVGKLTIGSSRLKGERNANDFWTTEEGPNISK